MLDDDLIDSFMSTAVLPGTRAVTFTAPGGGAAVTLDARREDLTADAQGGLGPAQAGTGERVYFVWVSQTGYTPLRPKWLATDAKDGTKWVVSKVDEDIQQRAVVVTCTRDNRA